MTNKSKIDEWNKINEKTIQKGIEVHNRFWELLTFKNITKLISKLKINKN